MRAKSAGKVEKKFEQALSLHKQGNNAEARKLYRSILKSRPDHPQALHFLGFLSHQSGDSEEAARLMRKSIELQPDYADALKNLGNVLLEMEQFEECENCYRRVIELYPQDPTVYSNLCVALRHQGRFKEAIKAGRDAIRLAPDYMIAWYNLGNACKVARDYKQAIECYEEAVKINPRFSPAHDSLCQSIFRQEKKGYLSRKTWKKSIRAYERWLECEPDSAIAQFMLSAVKGDEDLTRAPDNVIKNMFDRFAPNFEHRLGQLEYRVPDLIRSSLKQSSGEPQGNLSVLDGGCGTGLCAPILRPYASRLTGVDLSAGMMARAAKTSCYDNLFESELTAYLTQHPQAFDLAVFADTLCYFGDLEEVITASGGALQGAGTVLFSVEKIPWKNDPKGYRLHAHGRYSHSQSYIECTLSSAGFSAIECTEETLRMDMGKKVAGLIVTAKMMR